MGIAELIDLIVKRSFALRINKCNPDCLRRYLTGQVGVKLALHSTEFVSTGFDMTPRAVTSKNEMTIFNNSFCVDLTATALEHCIESVHVHSENPLLDPADDNTR